MHFLNSVNCIHSHRELTETVEANVQLRKQVSELTVQNQQQVGVNKVCMSTGKPQHACNLKTVAKLRLIVLSLLLFLILQASKVVSLEQDVQSENETIKCLEQKIAQDKVSQKEWFSNICDLDKLALVPLQSLLVLVCLAGCCSRPD